MAIVHARARVKWGCTLLLVLASAGTALAGPVPTPSQLDSLRSACASAKHVRLRARHVGGLRDSLRMDSSGVYVRIPAGDGPSITEFGAMRYAERLVPWSDIRRIETPNPKAHAGLFVAIDAFYCVAAALLWPASGNSLGANLAAGAGITGASMLTWMAATHGYQPDWLQAYPPR